MRQRISRLGANQHYHFLTNMKKLNIKIDKKTKVIAIVGITVIVAGLFYQVLKSVSAWYDSHTLIFAKPVTVTLNKPIAVIDRKTTPEIVKIVEQIPEYEDLNDIEKYICDKFGPYECKTAVAVARAESGMRELAFNAYNSNNTLDIGIFQINSVHYSKEGCSLKDLVHAEKNVDCAYKIWEKLGWNAWVAFQSGAFKDKL